MCGYRKIDGFVFCLGIDSLQISYRAGYDIQNLIRSTTYLIREAIFRSDYSLDSSSRSSLNILPLGELIDMYHSREATNRHDKVYALLGMSSDDLSKADLSPNYGVSWEILLQRLVKYLIPERTSVETWGDKEIAVIQSKGYVLGKVISVQKSEVRGDRNCVEVSLQEIPMQLKEMLQNGSTWIFQISAQTVKTGDFICLFKGASRPSIIRLHKDYSTIIMVAVPLSERRERKNEPITWPMHSLSGTLPSRNFLLVWNWETPPEYEVSEKYEDPEEYEIWLQRYEWRWEHSKLEIKNPLTRAIRTWNVALILGDITSPWGDSKEEREADYWGHDAMGNFETAIREERLLARKCQHGQTPLWCAEEDKYKVVDSVVNLLLTYDRIALDLKDEHYIKPLLVWVVQGKHEIIIKLLLETGKIEIDAKDQDERTPLWWAAQGGHETMVQLLLDTNKVDVDLKDNQLEQAPLSVAAQGGHEATVKLLLNYGKISVDSKDKNGKTPLWWAAWEGHKAAVQLLLKTGKIDVDFKGSSQRTALSAAAEKGHEEVVKMLLKTGKVDVNSKDYDNRTPLLLASENGHATVVKLLLETVNVEVNIKHRYGWTALSQAVDRGHEAVVKLLLDTGNVDVASKDDSAKTPLL
jgi:ankyrin repeat protein